MHETLQDLEPGGVRGILGGAVKCYNPKKTTCGEGVLLERLRREGRKLGEQTGLDTRVVLAVNAAS